MKEIICTSQAPQAIGTYSQAVKAGDTVYISGQIPLRLDTMELVSPDIEAQIEQVFRHLSHIAQAAGGSLKDVVKLTVYLTDIGNFTKVNESMRRFFAEPYPARVLLGISTLPKQAQVEMDAIMVLSD